MAQQPSEAGLTEQIISQFFLKTLQAVLAARIPSLVRPLDQLADAGSASPASASARVRRDRWFNLAIGDLSTALESPGFWQYVMMEPMIVDIVLSPRIGIEPEAVIERWTVQCETSQPWAPGTSPNRGSGEGSSSSLFRRTYKKSILLLRSIYAFLRLLPAYRAFRLLSSSNQSSNYDLSYKVSSFAEPFSREEEKRFKLQAFMPVDTQFGHLSVSVLFRQTLSDFNIEVSSMLPSMIIADYVGSPAADPIRTFPASPLEKGMRPITFPLRAVRTSSIPTFQRRHSWTPAPMAHNPLHTSLDAVSEQRPSPPDYFGQRLAIPKQSGHRKGSISFEEHGLSPPFSVSSTPSPPPHAVHAFRARLGSETAPVSIPQPLMGKNQLHRTLNFSDPTRSLFPPPSPKSVRADVPSEDSPSANRSLRKLDALKAGDLHSHLYAAPKALKDAKDDSGRFSGVLSSCGSPRFVFSRSSSRKSLQDDLEDFDFSYPFAVDDVDTLESHSRYQWLVFEDTDPVIRRIMKNMKLRTIVSLLVKQKKNGNRESRDIHESAQSSPHRSQDAAVGAFVRMLKTAPPLRQDHNSSSPQSSKSPVDSEAGTGSFFSSRKKSDALDELRSYRDLKESILSKSRTQLQHSQKQATQ